MDSGIIKYVLDFIKWLLLFLTGKSEAPINLTAVYDAKRVHLPTSRVGLLEIFEKQPQRTFTTTEAYGLWEEKMEAWFDQDQAVSEGETFAVLTDWANDEFPLVERVDSSLWRIHPSYEENRTKKEDDRTIFRK